MKDDNGDSAAMSSREAKAVRPGNLAFEASRKKTVLEVLLLVVSGVIYSFAFPPLNVAFIAWVALIPLYWIIRDKRPLKAFCYGFIWGYSFSCVAFFWLREIEFFIPFIMAAILAFFPALWSLLVPILRRYLFIPVEIQLKGYDAELEYLRTTNIGGLRQTYLVLVLASWWCVLELLRTWIFTGFPWNLTAVSQWKNPAIIQICEFTGVYGVSFVIVFLNISLGFAMISYHRSFTGGRYRRPLPFIVAIILVMLSVLSGSYAMFKESKSKNYIVLQAGVVQGNIPQCRFPQPGQAEYALDQYLSLSELLLISNPEIVIWPETAVPVPLRSDCEVGEEYRRRLGGMAATCRVPFLIGTIEFGDQPGFEMGAMQYPVHNSAVLIGDDGQMLQRYHKMHLVPFGEYTPFGKFYPALIRYFGMGRSLTPGKDSTIFDIKPGVGGAVNICYEDIFPEISRRHTAAGANLLIVLTNDAWYPKSSEPEQHLAHAVFRAVENRRPIIRSGNNSGTCLINSVGGIVDSISVETDPDTRQNRPAPHMKSQGFCVFSVKVPQNGTLTFYTRYGNVFVSLCILVTLSGMIHSLLCWRDKKSRLLAMRGNSAPAA